MNPIQDELQKLTKGLIYASESDFAVKAIFWEAAKVGAEGVTPDYLKKQAKLPAEAPVANLSFPQFFEPLLQAQGWYGEAELEVMRRYQALHEYLQANLTDLSVTKLGETTRHIYVLGKTKEGDFAGIATKSVET